MATLKLKKALKFYGSMPGNYDKETQEWIASTPPDKLDRDLQKYRAAVGVDFYNLDLGPVQYEQDKNISFNSSVDGRDLKEFYLNHLGGPLQFLGETRISTSPEEIILAAILKLAPQPVYKAILDKAIYGEEMSADEVRRIDQGISGGEVYQEYSEEKERYVLRRGVYSGIYGIIKAIFELVYDVSCQRIEVGRCAAEDCDNIFIPDPKNISKQIYCSSRCRARIWKRRARAAVAEGNG